MPFGQAAPAMNGLDQLSSGFGGLEKGLSSLFDPSKIAHAGYYGAEARRALVQGDQTISQMNMLPRIFAMTGAGVAPGDATGHFSALGEGRGSVYQPNNPNIQVAAPQGPPRAVPGAPMAPPPPQGGPAMQVAQAPPQGGPAMPVPPIPPPGGPPPAGAPLSSIIPGGGLPFMDTASVGDTLSNPNSLTNSGVTPPPSSPPSPGAPPSPNATGTAGGVLPTDGRLHPASITQPGGGVKVTGPAGPNGAPLPPINIAPLMATAAAAGMDAATQKNLINAYVNDAVSNGVLSQQTANQILEQAAVIAQQTTLTQQAMVNTAAQQRQDTTPYLIRDPTDPSKAIVSTNKGAVGQPGFDTGVAQQTVQGQREQQARQNTLVWVEDPQSAIGYSRKTVAQAQASGARIVDDKVAEAAGAPIQVYAREGDKDASGKPIRAGQPISMSARQAQQEGRQRVPTSLAEAEGAAAGVGGGAAVAKMKPPPGSTAEQNTRADMNRAAARFRRYPSTKYFDQSVHRIEFGGNIDAELDERTAKYYADSTNGQTYQNDAAAYSQAMTDMQREGKLPDPDTLRHPKMWDFFKDDVRTVTNEDGTTSRVLFITHPPQSSVFSSTPPTEAAPPGNNMTPQQMYGGSTTQPVPPQQGQGQGQGQPIGRAPPGTPDGPVVDGQGNVVGTSRGGIVYR